MQVDWRPIKTAPHNTFILVACPAQYTTIEWTYCIARFTEGWHDRWDDEGGDALMDRGLKPEFWTTLPDKPITYPMADEFKPAWDKMNWTQKRKAIDDGFYPPGYARD